MEGLQKFPDSALLQAKIGWTFVLALVWNWTNDAWRDTESAWTFAKMATDNPHKSRLESYLSQWLMARVRQFHNGDFAQSVVDAERAADLVPFDPFLRADLAQALFNAGKVDEAIKWLEEAIRRDATPMDWYFGNLAFAYYLADRPANAVEAIDKIKYTGSFFLAAPYARLGRLDEARAIIQKSLADTGPWTLEKEAVWPSGKQPQLVPWLLKPYLADLAKAGLPEK
jgi:tetratricopeptide (TPR) repeat protein